MKENILIITVEVSRHFRTFRLLSSSRSIYTRVRRLKDVKKRKIAKGSLKPCVYAFENKAIAILNNENVGHLIQSDTVLSGSDVERILRARSTLNVYNVTDLMIESDWEQWSFNSESDE